MVMSVLWRASSFFLGYSEAYLGPVLAEFGNKGNEGSHGELDEMLGDDQQQNDQNEEFWDPGEEEEEADEVERLPDPKEGVIDSSFEGEKSLG